MTEALPRSFTVSTAAHALVVAVGLVIASRAPAGGASRMLTIPATVMEIPVEVERPRPPPAVTPPAPVAAPPREPARAPASPRVAPSPAAPTPVAPSAAAPMAPAPVLTSAGGDPSMAASDTGSAAPTAVIAPSTPAPAVPTSPQPSAAPEGPAFDPGSYLAGVTDRVRRHRNYPAIAQEMGLEGTVEVRVVVAPDGNLAAPPSIDESCGHEVLDEEALRIVRRAAPFPPMVGRNQRVTLRVPVHFHLDT